MEPVVSLVVPAFNHVRYLEECIKSLLAQDYQPLEIIVIDDGSTDATLDALARYRDQCRVEHQEHSGQAATLNKGWNMARGELLGYLSADDVLRPGAVRTVATALRYDTSAVAAFPGFELIDPYSRVVRQVLPATFNYSDMILYAECPIGPGALFRRNAFESAGGWNPRLRQMSDYDFWLRIGISGRIIAVPQSLAAFRVHAESQTFGAVSLERAGEPVQIISALMNNPALPAEIFARRNKSLSSANIVSAQLHLRAGRFWAAWQHLREAIALDRANVVSPRTARVLTNALVNRTGHQVLWKAREAVSRIWRRRT